MAWTIDYSDAARKQLSKLDRAIAREIADFMDFRVGMLENPRSAGKALTADLNGIWRYRVRDYRILCDLQDQVIRVLVLKINHRKDVYR